MWFNENCVRLLSDKGVFLLIKKIAAIHVVIYEKIEVTHFVDDAIYLNSLFIPIKIY